MGHKKLFSVLALSCLVLWGCGGGGGPAAPQDSATVLAKYAGTWIACASWQSPSGPESEQTTWTLVKRTDKLALTSSSVLQKAADCKGGVAGEPRKLDFLVSFEGHKTVSGEVVDKVIYSRPDQTLRGFFWLAENGHLYTDAQGSFDAQGFPDAFNFTPLVRMAD